MTSLHLKFMDSVIDQPMHVIRKELTKGSRLREEVTDVLAVSDELPPFVFDIEEETLHVHGDAITGHRVYALTSDSREYHHLGYIASYEIEECMICRKTFGFMLHKHHCRCCGIVICQGCRPHKVVVFEIEQTGPQRVCNFCFYGQDPVYCTRTLRRPLATPSIPNINSSQNAAARKQSLVVSSGNSGTFNQNNNVRSQSISPNSNGVIPARISNNNSDDRNSRGSFNVDSRPQPVSQNTNTSSTSAASKLFGNAPVSNSSNANINMNNPQATNGSNMPARTFSGNGADCLNMPGRTLSSNGTESILGSANATNATTTTTSTTGQSSIPSNNHANARSQSLASYSGSQTAQRAFNVAKATNAFGKLSNNNPISSIAQTQIVNQVNVPITSNVFPSDSVSEPSNLNAAESTTRGGVGLASLSLGDPNSNPNPPKSGNAVERISSKMTDFKLITPTPSLVLKTKKLSQKSGSPNVSFNKPQENKVTELADGSKIFINITTDNAVPYTHEDSYDANKLINMVCGPFRVTMDKKGEISGVVDVVIHGDEEHVMLLDDTGSKRGRLFDQMLLLLQTMHCVDIENQLKVLTVNGNYKPSDDTGGGISKIAVPSSISDFYYKKQIFTFPSDIDKSTLSVAPLPSIRHQSIANGIPMNSNETSSVSDNLKGGSFTDPQKNIDSHASLRRDSKHAVRPSMYVNGKPATTEILVENAVPLCVIKSKRYQDNDEPQHTHHLDLKVFINIYYHEAVPYVYPCEPDECVVPGLLNGSFGSLEGGLLLGADPIAIWTSGFEDVEDKSGSMISVANVMVNSSAISRIENLNSEDPTTEKLICHIITVLNYFLKEIIDTDGFSLPKVKNNYKGDKLGTVKFTTKNFKHISADLEIFVVPSSDPAVSKFGHGIVLDSSFEETAQTGSKIANGKDDSVSKRKMFDLSLYTSIPFGITLINPKAGLVFQVSMSNGKLIYINLCHSDECIKPLEPFLIDYRESSLLLNSIIMGKVDINAIYRGVRSATIDFVIPSELFERVKPASFAGLTLNVLQPTSPIEVLFDALRTFLMDELYIDITNACSLLRDEYVGNNFVDGKLYSVINISLAQIDSYEIILQGAFSKKGSSAIVSWQKRLVEMSHGQIRYYEPSTNESRGQFDISRNVDVSLVNNNASIQAPDGSYAMLIRARNTADESKSDDFFLACANDEDRGLWKEFVIAYSKFSVNKTYLYKYPDMRIGWLAKQGGLIKTWHKRYFVLERGMLSYYEKDSYGQEYSKSNKAAVMVTDNNLYKMVTEWAEGGVQSGMEKSSKINPNAIHANPSHKKGHLLLKGALVTYDGKSKTFTVKNSLSDYGNKKDMTFEGESIDDINAWVTHIQNHIEWSNSNPGHYIHSNR